MALRGVNRRVEENGPDTPAELRARTRHHSRCAGRPLSVTWDADAIVVHRAIHAGVAVDTDRGLLVPVVRDAGSRGIGGLAAEIARLAEGARAGTLRPGDLSGATISVSNTGSYGSEAGTPLLDVTQASYRSMLDGYDPARINAVLLLTDGRNEDGNPDDDDDQETALIAELRKSATGEESRPVRIFTIAYGSDADTSTLKAIAEASNAAAYSAVDAGSIETVFTQVVSNF